MKPSLFPSSTLPLLLTLALLCPWTAAPADAAVAISAKQWDIIADKMIREENPPRLVAQGNVVLEKKEPAQPTAAAGRVTAPPVVPRPDVASQEEPSQSTVPLKTVTTIRADRVAYDLTHGSLEISGNVLLDIGPDHLAAESGVIDLEQSTGSFKQATVIRQDMDLHFEGVLIEKTGELTYHIEDGWVVTCKLQPGEVPPWSFAAADTQLTDGGYAFLKHATFRIKGFPVLYSPVMLLPAKRKRQTGLLFPEFFFSDRDGFGLETPLFVNLSPSADLTFYPRYFANRGFMGGVEFRYVSDDKSKGMITAHYLDDTLSDPSETEYYADGNFTHTNAERYWIRGKADQDIGEWTTRLDVDIVSDSDYLREFNSGSTSFESSNERFRKVFGRGFTDEDNNLRENSFAALRSYDNGTSLLAEISGADDVSETDYDADNPSPAWKLPSLSYDGLLPVGSSAGPDFAWNTNYTSFWREEGVTAQRVDLMPSLTTGIPLSRYLESNFSAGVRNTAYLIDDNGASEWQDVNSKNRFLYTLNSEVGTTLMRDFSLNFDEISGFGHTLRPFVAYEYTDIPDEKVLPIFDPIDELEEENAVYLGVNNFFAISGERNGRAFERDYLYFKVKQGYDFRSTESDTPLTPVVAETGWYPVERARIKYLTKVDVYGDGMFYHSIDGDYMDSAGDRFSLDYRFNEETDTDSIKGSVWYLLPYNLAAGYSLERSIEDKKTIEEVVRLRWTQPCWSVELSSHSESGDNAYMITFRLANIGSPFGAEFGGN